MYRVILYILKERYFGSEEFLAHKKKIASVVAEHNEVADYVSEIRSGGSFRLGASSAGAQAHLASFQNTSHWNYRRDRNVANYEAPDVHNCSLQVVRNAKADPLKYVMKYFGIKLTRPISPRWKTWAIASRDWKMRSTTLRSARRASPSLSIRLRSS
ncbi:HNH endonuclease family domain protein [Mycobacterium avium MAV_120709_2344]|nr:HNH endonuclease family domain protein [Mycobacterium avium MAV_120709_2344]